MNKFYFNDEQHLINYFKKWYKKDVDFVFLERVYEKCKTSEELRGILSSTTFELRNGKDVEVIERNLKSMRNYLDNPLEFINFQNEEFKKFYRNEFCKTFLDSCCNLQFTPGIYFMYNFNKQLIYIGKSVNLSNRMISSSREREPYYIKYKTTKSFSDCHVLELYYINLLKPCLNKSEKSQDDLTFEIKYDFIKESDFIKVFNTGDDNE